MTFPEKNVIAVLSEWRSLFLAIESIPLDPEGELDTLLAGLDERQRLIEEIQRLDGDVKSIAALALENWPGFSPEDAKKAETLLCDARSSREATCRRDAAASDFIDKLRALTLSKIQKAKHCKKYLPLGKDAVKHAPIIVDDRV
jgi:hypothetical protein